MQTTNKQHYENVDSNWATRAAVLTAPERQLIGRFIRKDRPVLEAGTAGGRILLAMEAEGYTGLAGFDYVESFIAAAERKSQGVSWKVADARRLPYGDAEFPQIIYLQQIISSIDDVPGRAVALREAFRILQPGGTALFSFCAMEARMASFPFAMAIRWLRLLRKLRNDKTPRSELPWFLHNSRPNWGALLDSPPYVGWYTVDEALALVREAGFDVTGITDSEDAAAGKLWESGSSKKPRGMLFLVCKKPGA